MAFTVVWLRGPLTMGTENFDDLKRATAHAEDQMPQMQRRFGATAVKIVDDIGTPHFLKAISRNG
jgi:hypothetical protein